MRVNKLEELVQTQATHYSGYVAGGWGFRTTFEDITFILMIFE
jgi:hypothetical protein